RSVRARRHRPGGGHRASPAAYLRRLTVLGILRFTGAASGARDHAQPRPVSRGRGGLTAEAPLSSLLSALMFCLRPRENVMIKLSAVPASSHGAELARVISMPAAAESRLPDDVSTLTTTTAARNRAGGLTATVSRSLGCVSVAASKQATTNIPPVNRPQPSRSAASRPKKHNTNIASTAPRPVSFTPAGSVAAAAAGRAQPLFPAWPLFPA